MPIKKTNKTVNSSRFTGFTIIEMILAMVIVSIIVVSIAQMMLKGIDSYSLIVDRREAVQGARLAANIMSTELATITSPATDISSISATSITFTPAGGGGAITYLVSGSNLLRNSKVLASSVTAATGFTYFTSGGAVTSDAAQVHRIGITVAVTAQNPANGTVTVKENVYLRNRYYSGFIKN